MSKILLIEDDESALLTTSSWLRHDQFLIDAANCGIDGLNFLKTYTYDLIILDWQLPDISGIDILKQYRAIGGGAPILMLTAHDKTDHKEIGFGAGADDYLTKPFEYRELLLRVRALLKRRFITVGTTLSFADLTMDKNAYTVMQNGMKLKLAPKEFALLEFFMRHPNEVFTSEQILQRVWDDPENGSVESLRVWINKLRGKLCPKNDSAKIVNIFGVGYKLES